MSSIRKAIVALEEFFGGENAPGPRADMGAVASIEDRLRCRIRCPNGRELHTDVSRALGGTASANSPGWLARAALASCNATGLAMRAARLGIRLDSIEVGVEAMSDGRGLFLDQDISPGTCDLRVRFRVSARDVPREQIQEMVDWVVAHSPVGADFERPVAMGIELEVI
ncbi:MAG TPA: OsmC family protein [Gammaproteobacteria bacterium]|nr:OsmC family protein [Gammaproteobacteria bacterium]